MRRGSWLAGLVLLGGLALAAEGEKPGVVVLGVACTGQSQEWRDGLVGFGIQNWVAQALYDSGQYRMVEEKEDVLRAVQPKLDATFEQLSKGRREEMEQVARALGADVVVLGRVSSFFPRPSGMTLGPMQRLQRDTQVKVELTLFDARTGKVIRGEATGKVDRSRTTVGVDTVGGKLPFDPTTVGPATQEGVEKAVARLVPSYQPRKRGVPAPELAREATIGVLPLSLRPEVSKRYPELMERRVALGIHNRVLRCIGGTPKCQLQEIDPEVLKALELQWWVASNGAPPAEEVVAKARNFSEKLDWIVYGEVFSFALHQREALSGLSGKVSHEVVLGVQLRAVNPRAQPVQYRVASGVGREVGDWESWKGKEIDFAQTFVGKAAQRAVEAAWPALLQDLAGGK